jgi:plasmid stability protein
MATLYVENVPEDIYEAIRAGAKAKRTSIATEVIQLLVENVVTPKEQQRRQALLERALQMRASPAETAGPFPSVEEMLREDRAR